MNRLTRPIRELREELERADRRAPGGDEGLNFTVLEDASWSAWTSSSEEPRAVPPR